MNYDKIASMPEQPACPPWFKPGLLLPKAGWKPGDTCPLFSPSWELTDAELARPDEGDGLIPFCWHIFRQRYNSCGPESGVTMLQTVRRMLGLPNVVLNPLYVYHFVSGGRDAGAHLVDVLKVLRDRGCASEESWPYANGWQRRPSDDTDAATYKLGEFYEVTTVRQFRSALRLRYAVACGSRGHAVGGLKDMVSYPVVANTWGRTWGENGFGRWDSYANLFRYRVFAYRTVETIQ